MHQPPAARLDALLKSIYAVVGHPGSVQRTQKLRRAYDL
jgi:hypothetical protein